VIANNPKLFEKTLWSELGDGEPVRVLESDSEEHEAERAVARIQSSALRAAGGAKVRRLRHALPRQPPGRVLRAEAARRADPVQGLGRPELFDRAEIKDLCAWLRLLVNNDDDPAFLRAVTTPKRGIGHQTLASLGDFASQWKTSLFEALFAPSLPAVLKGKAVDALHEFGREVNDLEHRAGRTTAPSEARKALLLGWLKDIGYEQHLHDGEDSEKLAAARWANVLDFVDWIAAAAAARSTRPTAAPPAAKARPCCRWRRPSASSSAWPNAATIRTW
jgi:ATP-dependent DNA helicase Rep